jgi:hypothetical protein
MGCLYPTAHRMTSPESLFARPKGYQWTGNRGTPSHFAANHQLEPNPIPVSNAWSEGQTVSTAIHRQLWIYKPKDHREAQARLAVFCQS